MNQELIEILLSIYQIDKSSKTILCSKVPGRMCAGACNVCPTGHMHIYLNGRPHYLNHLIALTDRGNV